MSSENRPFAQSIDVGEATLNLSERPPNLGVVLQEAMSGYGAQRGIVWVDQKGNTKRASYAVLHERALQVLGVLQERGTGSPGELVLLQVSDAFEFFASFWACAIGGLICVPVTIPPVYASENASAVRLLKGWEALGNPQVLFDGGRGDEIAALLNSVEGPKAALVDLDSVPKTAPVGVPACPTEDDTVVLFMTSGSTGLPKAVPQTHGSLISMAQGTVAMNGFDHEDVTLNWMPTDHVGALSFLGIMPTLLGADQVHVSTEYVLRDPIRWLEKANEFSASISWAPNFAFSLYLNQRSRILHQEWDLSKLSFLVNAGEAVNGETAAAFLDLLAEKRLPANALRPAFGMSETCSGITWSSGFIPSSSDEESGAVSLGKAIPGARLRIVNQEGEVVNDGEVGRLLVAGPSVTKGYWKNPEANRDAFLDEWLITGDLGFLKNGELYITGREKEVIIVNGVNLHCHEIESAVESIKGVASTFAAACAVRAKGAETDQLAVFFVVDPSSAKEGRAGIASQIRRRVTESFGVNPAFLFAVDSSEIPKTEIGKLQRLKLKAQFESGAFEGRELSGDSSVGETSQSNSKRTSASRASERRLQRDITAIWEDSLGVSVGPQDTFFELGGHSLLIPQIQEKLEQLVGREIKVTELFNLPTVSALARYFSEDGSSASTGAATTSFSAVESEGIAVIGMACRFPGAPDLESFWDVLVEGRDTITRFTEEEVIAAGVDPALAQHPDYVKAGPTLENIETFDAAFFNVTAREARMMDPQHRVFLETCWEAFEDAGLNPLTMESRAGVFAGALLNTYFVNNLYTNSDFLQQENGGALLRVESQGGFNLMINNDKDYLPTRVAYKLNLRGPAINVQTACSSTLVAIHSACESLYRGDCDVALAGGISVSTPQAAGHLYVEGMINSADGCCRAYDDAARGTIFGNGSGVVLLKPLSAALRDGDRVYTVIKGTAVNNDGDRKVGFTAPSQAGESGVIEEALRKANVNPETVGYVEGHGTGTAIGDPIEIEALSDVYRRYTSKKQYCEVGSVKSNIGHMQVASGIAGFIKAALAVSKGVMPGTVHLRQPNQRVDWESSPFYVSAESRPWPADLSPRRAGVNSLGIGGTNCHVILEEAPEAKPRETDPRSDGVLTLSGRNPAALESLIERYRERVATDAECDVADLAYTSNLGRAHWLHRKAIAFNSQDELLSKLIAGGVPTEGASAEHSAAGVVYLFTGQGAQFPGMGEQLFQHHPIFREAMQTCDAAFQRLTGASLLDAIFDQGEAIHRTELSQPALFALQYSLGSLWSEIGIAPDRMVGHSVGEYAAACLAEVFSVDDAMKLLEARGRLMQHETQPGAMLAAVCSEEHAAELIQEIDSTVAIASVNAVDSVVFSGRPEQMDALAEALTARSIRHKRLEVSRGFHSPLMEPIVESFREVAESVEYHLPSVQLHLTGGSDVASDAAATPDYWVRHLTETVRFWGQFEPLLSERGLLAIEIGPQPALLAMVGATAKDRGWQCLPSMRRKRSDVSVMFDNLAQVYAAGWDLDWAVVHQGRDLKRVKAPLYPWQRSRYWVEPGTLNSPSALPATSRSNPSHPMVGRMQQSPMFSGRLFEAEVSADELPMIGEHQVFGCAVTPAAAHLSAAAFAGVRAFGSHGVELRDVVFSEAMVFAGSQRRTLQIYLGESGDSGFSSIDILSSESSEGASSRAWTKHAAGQIIALEAQAQSTRTADFDVELAIDGKTHYQSMRDRGIDLGPGFQWADGIGVGGEQSIMRLKRPDGIVVEDNVIQPGLVDSFLQAVVYLLTPPDGLTVVPFQIGRFRVHDSQRLCATSEFLARAFDPRATGVDTDHWRGIADVELCDLEGRVLISVEGFELRQVREEQIKVATESATRLELRWQPATRWLMTADPTKTTRGCWCLIGGDPDFRRLVAGAIERSGAAVRQFSSCSEIVVDDDVSGVLDLTWTNLEKPSDEGESHDWIQSVLDATRGTARLVESLSRLESRIPVWQISTNAHQVTGEDRPASIAGRALWGLGRSLRLECTELDCRLVDLDSEPESIEAWIANLLNGIDEDQVAIRSGSGFVARFAESKAEASPPDAQLEGAASYLVTGGFGGLGRAVIGKLVLLGARRISVLARSSPPVEMQEQIDSWMSTGVQIEVIQGSVSQGHDVARALAAAQSQGPLRGIVHCAGVLGDGLLNPFDEARYREVIETKMLGAWNLHEQSKSMDLDFFVSFSSIAAAIGAAGQTAYALANAGVDAVAELRRGLGLPSVALQWGPWRAIGMAARLDENHQRRAQDRGLEFLSEEVGLDCLEGSFLATTPVGVQVIAALELSRFASVGARNSRVFDSLQDGNSTPAVLDSEGSLRLALAECHPEERRLRIEEEILTGAASLLGLKVDELSPTEGLLNQGIDSLLSIELKGRLESRLKVSLSTSLIFDYPSARLLSGAIDELLFGPEHGAGGETSQSNDQPASIDEGESEGGLTEEELERQLAAEL